MRFPFIIFCITLLASCGGNSAEKTDSKDSLDTEVASTELMLGERIDGPANIRDTVNGKTLFSLYDNTLVETGETSSDWLQVGIFIALTPEQVKDAMILPASYLYSADGEVIGRSTDTVPLGIWGDNGSGQIFGYTHRNNIKSNSVPENCLSTLLAEEKTSRPQLQAFMTSFRFQKYEFGELKNITQYMIDESTVVDPSPRDRITLLFRDNLLVGFIHSRAVNAGKYKTYDLIRGHKLTITADLPQSEIKDIIEKRIHFLNSVD